VLHRQILRLMPEPASRDVNSQLSRCDVISMLKQGRQGFYRWLSAEHQKWKQGGVDELAVVDLLGLIAPEHDPFLRAQVGAFLGRVMGLMPDALRRTVGTALMDLARDPERLVQRIGFDACSVSLVDSALRYHAAQLIRSFSPPEDEFIADRHLAALRRAAETFSDDLELSHLLEESSRSNNRYISGLGHFHLAVQTMGRLAEPARVMTRESVDEITTRIRFAGTRIGNDARLEFLDAILTLLRRSLDEGPGPKEATDQELIERARAALATMLQDSFDAWSAIDDEIAKLAALLQAIERLLDLLSGLMTLPDSEQFRIDFAFAISLAHAIIDTGGASLLNAGPGAGEAAFGGPIVAQAVQRILLPEHAARLHELDPRAHERIRRTLDHIGADPRLPRDLLEIFGNVSGHGGSPSKEQTGRVQESLASNHFAIPTHTYLGGHPNAERRVREVVAQLEEAVPNYIERRRELFQHVLAILINYVYKSWEIPRALHLRVEDEIWEPLLERKQKGLGEKVREKKFQADIYEHLKRSDIAYYVTREDSVAGSRIDFQVRFPSVTFPIEAKIARQPPYRDRVRSRYLAQPQGYTVLNDQVGFQVILDVSPKPKDTIEPNLQECIWWESATDEHACVRGGVAVVVCYGNRWKEQSARSTYG
jgi:hypothetical protein